MIVAGFGFRRGVDIAALRAALALAQSGLAVTALATLRDKAPALAELAAALDLPLIAVTGSNGKTTVTQMIASILRAAAGDAAAGDSAYADGTYDAEGAYTSPGGNETVGVELGEALSDGPAEEGDGPMDIPRAEGD